MGVEILNKAKFFIIIISNIKGEDKSLIIIIHHSSS